MRAHHAFSIALLVTLSTACRSDHLGADRADLTTRPDGRDFGGDFYGDTGPDAGPPPIDAAGPPIFGDAGPPRFPDGGITVPPDAPPRFPDGGITVPPDALPRFPDGGITVPPDAPISIDAGVSDAPIYVDASLPDAPPASACFDSPDVPCTGSCACKDVPDDAFGACIAAADGVWPQPFGPLAIASAPDGDACNAPGVFDTLVCVNGASWTPPPRYVDASDQTHFDVHHDHNHSEHADDDRAAFAGEGSEFDVCAWCVDSTAGARLPVRTDADPCNPLPRPTDEATARAALQCLWDAGKGWEDAKAAFTDAASRTNLDKARKAIVDELAKQIKDKHKVVTGISGSEGADSDIDVSVQYADLCKESDVAAAIKMANAEFARKVVKHPVTLGKALDVNFYFGRDIPVRGMADNPGEIAASEADPPNPERLDKLHEIAAMVKLREYARPDAWTAFHAKLNALDANAKKYQLETIKKTAETWYGAAEGKLKTQTAALVEQRKRAGTYDPALDAADVKVAAKIALYETAMADVQSIRNARLTTAIALKAAQGPAIKPLKDKLRDQTYEYEEASVKSSFYADQAYYARGSLLVVVAKGQGANRKAGKDDPVLTVAHYYQSMIEQTGDLMKDLAHAKGHSWKIGKTGLKTSKYATRFLDAGAEATTQLKPKLAGPAQADATKLIKALGDAGAVASVLLKDRKTPVDDALERSAATGMAKLGIANHDQFESVYLDWCAKVIIFKRQSENR